MAGYVGLYSQARLDTLDALDKLVELRQAEELKSKLLFSIIVVSTLTYTHSLSHSHSLTVSLLTIFSPSSPSVPSPRPWRS